MTSSSVNAAQPDADKPLPSPAPARKPRYTLRPVVKPLGGGDAGGVSGKTPKPVPRAENEDDDGYDPYSDFHDGNAAAPTFEADPWR